MPTNEAHYEVTCTACGRTALAKAGAPCAYCGGTVRKGGEYTRKTFGADDNDLRKNGLK